LQGVNILPRISARFVLRLFVFLLIVLGLNGCRSASTRPAHDPAARVRSLVEEDVETGADRTAPASLEDLSLEACVALALGNNRGLARSRSARERAVLGESAARSDVFAPELTARYNTDDSGDSSSASASVTSDALAGFELRPFLNLRRSSSDEDETETTAYGVELSRPLFAIYEHVRQRLPLTRAASDRMIAENDVRLQERTLRLDVTQRYFAAQRSAARLRVRESRVADSRKFLDITSKRVDSGFAAPIDIVNARIDLNRSEAAQVSEQVARENALEALREVLGLELSESLTLGEIDLSDLPEFARDPAGDEVRVVTHHERVVNLLLRIKVADDEIRIQRDAARPRLTASVTATREGEGDGFFDDSLAEDDQILFGVSYAAALDANRADRARLKQLEREQEERLLQLKDAEIELARELRSTARSIAELETQIELAEARFEAEQDKLKATLATYERGGVDNLEVTRAKQTVDDAEIRLLESRINLLIAIERYRSLVPAASDGSR